MTLTTGEKFITLQTKTGPVTIPYSEPAVGDKVLFIPDKNGNRIAVKYGAPTIGDTQYIIQAAGGKPISYFPSTTEPLQMRIMIPSGDNLSYRSTDAGASWGPQAYTMPAPYALVYAGKGVAFAVSTGYGCDIYKSTDYGVSWSLFVNAADFLPESMEPRHGCMKLMADGNLCMICRQYFGSSYYLAHIYTVNTTTGAVAHVYDPGPTGNFGAYYGATAREFITVGQSGALVAVFPVRKRASYSNQGYSTRNEIKIMRSWNNGATWSTVFRTDSPTDWYNYEAYNIGYLGEGKFFIPARKSELDSDKYNASLRSSDNGYTWEWGTDVPASTVPYECSISPRGVLPGLVLYHCRNIYYNPLSEDSRIYRSVDYGETWELVHNEIIAQTYNLYFVGEHTYLAYGLYSQANPVMISTDDGASWSHVAEARPTGGYGVLIW
jgi:hypothetical protein